MVQIFINLLKSIRPRQALKNLSIFAPLVFSGNLFIREKFLTVLSCAFIFTILASSIYLINDIVDIRRDRLHPLKKNRPIASGKLPIPIAIFFAILGIFLALILSYILNFFFFLTTLGYFLLQIIYNFSLKNIIILDVLAIAADFILRVYAGAFVINIHMNVWFLLCVISLSLFLAVGKRRAELTLLTEKLASRHRKTLTFYSPQLLDAYLTMFANSSWLAYALFTFFSPLPPVREKIPFLTQLPLALAGVHKWLMITIPVVIFGIMRYMTIIYQGKRTEAPEKILLSDRPLLAAIILWGILVIFIIYGA